MSKHGNSNGDKKSKNSIKAQEKSGRHSLINTEEIKEHKAITTLYIILRTIIVGLFILSIVRGEWENSMTLILSFVLLMIPSFIERRLKVDVPNALECIVICFVFAANVMGEIGAFYEKIPMWDTILHTLNGFVCAAVGFGLIDILNEHDKIKMNLSPLFVCLFSFCFSMTAGTMWEFFEFGADMFLGKDMQKDTIVNVINSVLLTGGNSGEITSIKGITDTIVNGKSLGIGGYLDIGIIDTMKDLLVNFLGAVVFNFAGFFYIKSRSKRASFIESLVPKRVKEDKTIDG